MASCLALIKEFQQRFYGDVVKKSGKDMDMD
jgi:hypothetical protein